MLADTFKAAQEIKDAPLPEDFSLDGDEMMDAKWSLREQVHVLHRLEKELVSRVQALRYFKAVRDLQLNGAKVDCVACGDKNVVLEKQAVLSCCGRIYELFPYAFLL
jgi:hypothetical protein